MDVRVMVLYANTVAARSEIDKLRQSIGATSYQIDDELDVRSLSPVLSSAAHAKLFLPGQYQKVFTAHPPQPICLPLQRQDTERVHDC